MPAVSMRDQRLEPARRQSCARRSASGLGRCRDGLDADGPVGRLVVIVVGSEPGRLPEPLLQVCGVILLEKLTLQVIVRAQHLCWIRARKLVAPDVGHEILAIALRKLGLAPPNTVLAILIQLRLAEGLRPPPRARQML